MMMEYLIGASAGILLTIFVAFVASIFEGKHSHPYNGRTVVYLRSTQTPAQFWEATVYYDPWNVPYVTGNGTGPRYGNVTLFQSGRTSGTWLYGTEWRHKSGPPVEFANPPARPFTPHPRATRMIVF